MPRIVSTARFPPASAYSVGRFLEDAARALRDAKVEGRLPVFVGGTGLYFKALTEGLAAGPRRAAGDSRALARRKPSGSARTDSIVRCKRAIPSWRQDFARAIPSGSCARWK